MTSTTTARRVESPTGRRYVQLVLVLGALIALGPLTIDMYLPAFPRIREDLGTTDSAVQLTLTGMLLGLAVGQLVIGPLSDAFGRRRPLVVGICVHATASALCALAPTVEVLATVRVLQGFAGAAISVTAMAIVRDLFEGVAVARLMSRLMLVIGLAPIIAPTLGGLVLQVTTWRGIFVLLGAAALVLVVVAVLGVRETLPPERRRPATVRSSLAAYRSLLRDRVFVALTFIAGLMLASLFSYVSGASFVLQDGFGLDAQTFGLVFGLNSAGLTLTSQLNPVMLRWWSVRAVLSGAIVAAFLASSALLVAGLTGAGLLFVLVPLGLVVATAGLSLPNTPALALTRCVQFGVGALVAPLVGAFGSGTATPMAVVMVTLTVLAGLLMFGVVQRERTPPLAEVRPE
ncbi:MAG: multidrug effflux MFS transporter [Nocardioidaceae bacterium]|nr:multidrug effflux MFS transporter [Nocardioidaceae bacterium]